MISDKFYWLYILEVVNGKLYTGYSADIVRRYREHVKGTAGSKFTRAFKVKGLRQCWRVYGEPAVVMKIEVLIKRQTREKKLALIRRPQDLKALVEEKFAGRMRIYTFNPQKVIKAAAGDDSGQVKKYGTLFRNLAEKDY